MPDNNSQNIPNQNGAAAQNSGGKLTELEREINAAAKVKDDPDAYEAKKVTVAQDELQAALDDSSGTTAVPGMEIKQPAPKQEAVEAKEKTIETKNEPVESAPLKSEPSNSAPAEKEAAPSPKEEVQVDAENDTQKNVAAAVSPFHYRGGEIKKTPPVRDPREKAAEREATPMHPELSKEEDAPTEKTNAAPAAGTARRDAFEKHKHALHGAGNVVAEQVKMAGGAAALREKLTAEKPAESDDRAIVTPQEQAKETPEEISPEEKKAEAVALAAEKAATQSKNTNEGAKEATEKKEGDIDAKTASTLASASDVSTASGKNSIRPIRTFRDDIARVLQSKQTSLVDAVSAEQERNSRNEEAAEVPSRGKKSRSLLPYIFVFVSAMLVTGGIGAFAIYYFFAPEDITRVTVEDIPVQVFTEEQRKLELYADESQRDVVRKLLDIRDSTALTLGALSQVYLVEIGVDEEGMRSERLWSSEDFFNRLELSPSDAFRRTLTPEMTFGFHAFDGTQPFLILKTTFYEQAFAGMLEWEDAMNGDLAPLFGEALRENITVGSTTRSRPANLPFDDEVIDNKEVRILYDTEGKQVLLYGFPDTKTIIVTTNEFTFKEIVTRLNSIRI